jgi:hypothetical protein
VRGSATIICSECQKVMGVNQGAITFQVCSSCQERAKQELGIGPMFAQRETNGLGGIWWNHRRSAA